MSNNYTIYHLHSSLSNGITNIDSVTKYDDYIEYAHNLGMTTIGFSEHGSVFEHIKKRQMCEKYGMKFIHGEEFYVTEKLTDENGKKIKDNYHMILMAKNYEGYKELNRLSTLSFNRATVKSIDDNERYYYSPRITFDEVLSTSDNIIITSACLGGIFGKGSEELKQRFLKFLADNKHRCFLEIQHHKNREQIEYNDVLYSYSQKYGIPLIAGTDTHCLNAEHEKGRKILQISKDIHFAEEDGWDLNFKTYDELCEAYREQDSLPEKVYLEAIENTNRMADMIEPYKITNEYKYPHLWEDPVGTFKELINKGFKDKGLDKLPNKKEYVNRVKEEFDTYVGNDMVDFMLLADDMISFCKKNDIEVGYGRGSVNGSVIAWILGLTEMDSLKFNLNFQRFANPERKSLADVDTDFPSNQRDMVKKYLFGKDNLNCCDIITFNTIALRGAIRDVARALNIPLNEVGDICDLAEENRDKAKELYPELMEYVDIIEGTIVSIGVHPCGCVVSDLNIAETFGLCTTSNSDYPVSQIYMKEIDSLNYVKLDLLCLDTIQLINDTCKLIGIPRLTPDNVPLDDAVWDSIVEDTTLIFQWESDSAQDYIKHLMSKETLDKFKSQGYDVDKMMLFTIGNGAIRPAGASYRDSLANGEVRKTGCKAIDDCMASTFGYCVFQCQIIEFLHKCCGFTMGEADIVRRGFAKKTGTEQFIPVIKDGGYLNDNKNHYIKGFIQTMKDDYGYDESFSNECIISFIKVIEDASMYLFSINHSLPYTYEGYVSGYLRYYYPLEFLTSALNICSDDLIKTAKVKDYANKRGIEILTPKFRHSSSGYMCDKGINKIYKGMSSIKFLNETVARQLYDMRDQIFDSFIDFLKVNPCDSKQTKILIKLDFFSEFGKSGYLMNIFDLYSARYNTDGSFKKIIKKDNNPYPVEILKKYSAETEKQFRIENEDEFIGSIINTFEDKSLPITEILEAELEYYGYICYTNSKAQNWGYITEINTKYTPKLSVYKLDTGEMITLKISKNDFAMSELREKTIFKFITEDKPKRKLVDGHWTESDETEPWIKVFRIYSK